MAKFIQFNKVEEAPAYVAPTDGKLYVTAPEVLEHIRVAGEHGGFQGGMTALSE